MRRRQRARRRLLRVIFFLSLAALMLSVAALVLAQRRLSRRLLEEKPSANVRILQDSLSAANEAGTLRETIALETVAENGVREGGHYEPSDPDVPAAHRTVLPEVPDELRESARKAGLTDERIAQLKAENAGNYYFDTLSEKDAALYAELYHIITAFASDVYVSASDTEQLERVQNCVMNDHPEIFHVSGYYSTRYTLGGETVGFSFSGRYTLDREEAERRNALIDRYIETCLSGVPSGADDYGKVRYIYEYLIAHTSYNLQAADNQNICSVMIGGESVCQGYAKAAQLLLNRTGIPATLVVGTVNAGANSGPHAWNLVRADGNWYYLDVTWGDASFFSGDGVSEGINYEYLLTTTAEITKTHTVGGVAPMPVCDCIDDNYYVRDGAYFTESSLEAFEALVHRKREEGAAFLTLKCSDGDVYDALLGELIDNSQIFDYIYKAPGESLSFTRSPEHLSFTVWF